MWWGRLLISRGDGRFWSAASGVKAGDARAPFMAMVAAAASSAAAALGCFLAAIRPV